MPAWFEGRRERKKAVSQHTNNDVEDWFGYGVAVRLREGVVLARSPRQGVIGAVTWEQRDVGMLAKDELGSLKDVVADLVRGFLHDYQKTHEGVRIPPAPAPTSVPKAYYALLRAFRVFLPAT